MSKLFRNILFFCFFAVFLFSYEIRSQVDSIGLTTPKLIYPSSETEFDLFSSTPIFKWTESQNANGYEINIFEVNEKKENEVFFSTIYTIILNNQFQVPDSILNMNKKYSLKLRAYNSTNFSDFSKPVYFTILKPKIDLPNTANKILPPAIISKNNLIINSSKDKIKNHKLVWSKTPNADSYELILEGINSSTIFGENYFEILNTSLQDTLYNLDSTNLTNYNSFRWKLRSNVDNKWSDFTDYYYFKIQSENAAQPLVDKEIAEPVEELVLRLRYSSYIDEMLLAKEKDGKVYVPLLDIISKLKIPFEENLDSKEISIQSLSNSKLKNAINFNTKELVSNQTKNSFTDKDFISDEFDYYVNSEVIGKLLEGNLEADLRQMSIKFNSANQLPIVARLVNEKKLLNDKNAYVENEYPLLYDRRRNNLSGGFLDYSLTGNYVENENPFYSFNFGLGGELLGGDAQIFSQHSLFQNKFIYNQTEYRWRYAFLNNKDISSISLGNNNIFGLQSYNFRGINITNQPLESRRFYGKHKIEEKTNPFWKVEVLQNNNLIDIVQADENGNYNFNIPFTYGTTLIELHQYGPNGEHTQQRKMYQIPVNQIPEGEYEYSANFGRLITISENLFQASGAYGFNDWLTSEIGTDVFTNDFSNSSIYSKTSTRFFDGYVTNLTLAPNAFYELEVNSIFSDLASFNLGSKIYETNPKFNPTNIKNEFDGNLFIPFSISESLFSLLFRGSRAEFNDFNRYDFSVRTFYDINNFSPSIEYDYYALSRNNFSSSYLNFRLNYSFYLPSNIFGGNIIDSRLVYNINNSDVESFNITFATTFLQNYRIQLSHNINFNSNFSDTQLRVVFDLPFLRSNTNLSKSVFTQSVLGSVNYNNIFNDFDFHNRGMVGKSAAAIRFFLDENNNNLFERGEKQIEDMNVNINSIGNKRQLSNGSIVINDLEAYTKYDVTLIDKKSKNPLWFPVREKFSFISDPNHFKEVAIPFYEAAVVNGSVMKLVGDKEIPVEGINVILKKNNSDAIIKIRTMSDGSFYQYGIEPGDYEIYVDETQLERIKLKSYPEKIETKVYSINSENYNKDLEFILK